MSKRITIEEFNRRIEQRFPLETFSIIGYEGTGKPAKFLCEKCKEIIEVSKAINFLAKNKRFGCKNCHGFWREREEILNKIKERYDILKIETLPNGQSTKKYYTIQCKKCGHIRKSILRQLEKHLDCGCTTGMFKWGADDFKKKFKEKFSDYELIDNYSGMPNKHLIKHECGFIFKTRLSDFYYAEKNSHMCPKCKKNLKRASKGQKKIKDILQELQIIFEEESRLDNSLLRFDFYFEFKNKKFAIEYNGEQHYRAIDYFGGEERLIAQQERDRRKRKYCEEKGINLLEIRFDEEKDFKEIILSFISSTTKVAQAGENAS